MTWMSLRGKPYARCSARNAASVSDDSRSACAKRAALEAEESGYVTHKVRCSGSALRNEKTRFHSAELARRSAAMVTCHRRASCSTTLHTIRGSVVFVPGSRPIVAVPEDQVK